MRIRPLAESDLDVVVRLALANFDGELAQHHSAEVLAVLRHDVTVKSFREQMAHKQILVAEEASGIVATGALADYGDAGRSKYAVSQFYVRADLHGRGIDRQLLDHLTAMAVETGAENLHVPSSRNAVPFYAHAGFAVDESQPDTALEITWMTKSLGGTP